MIGASAMLASRVLSAERAINSLNRHIFLTIVSMLALSHAIEANRACTLWCLFNVR